MPSTKVMAKDAKSKKSSAPSKQNAKVPPKAFNLSTEFVQDSDEDADEKSADESSSDNGSVPANAAPALSKANGKVITATRSSSSGSGSESAEESSSEDGEEEGESGESEEEEDDEEESLPSPDRIKPVSAAARQFQKENNPPTVVSKKPPPYEAPAGFEIKSIDAESNSSKLLKASNLEGKQIWYITTPASVSIASIEEISLWDIKKGKKSVSHDGVDYGFVQDTTEDKTYTKILVPNSSDEGYRAVSKPMDQVLHLRRIVRLPGMNTDDDSDSRATVPAKKPIRPQPKGLKMRFRPLGFGEGKMGKIGSSSSSSSDSDSDEEMQDVPTAKRQLVSPSADSSTTSPEASDEDSSSNSDVEMIDAPPQLPKKPSKSVESPAASGTLKRKHSEATKSKSKNSSSQSTTTTDHKQLKRIKTKQTESQKAMVDSRSVSTEKQTAPSILPPQRTSKISSSMPPPSTPTPKSSTSILPPSASSAPRSTSKTAPILPSQTSSTPRSTVKSTPVPPPRQMLPPRSSEIAAVHSGLTKPRNETPSRESKTKLSLEAQIAAIDSNLSTEQRNDEIKRLKRNESSRISKAKRRNSTAVPVEGKVDVKVTPIPPPSQRSGTNRKSPVTDKAELGSATKEESQESMERKERRERKEKKKQKKWLSEKADQMSP